MRSGIIFFIELLTITTSASSQNLVFFGNKSYSSIEVFRLESKSQDINDVELQFLEKDENKFILISLEEGATHFTGDLLIYLDDGSVITCQNGEYDAVDNIAYALYTLSNEDLLKMKKGGINTIRFDVLLYAGALTKSYSASNRYEIDPGKPEGNLDDRALYGSQGGASIDASLQMAGWVWDFKPKPNDKSNETGKIVYRVTIDDEGYITKIELQSSTVSPEMQRLYRQSVERLSFNKTSEYKPAPTSTGTITFHIQTK